MASTKKITILQVCHIPPFSKSQTSPSSDFISLPLTFSDIFNLKFPPVQSIFFYKLTESTTAFFNSVVLPKLKHSLSVTLLHFHPLAGSLIWPENSAKPIIVYGIPHDGIPLTVAESIEDLDHLYTEVRDAAESHPYVAPLPAVSDTKASTLAFQVTLFPGKGFTISYTINHAILDGRSISLFMNAWAHICKHLDEQERNSPSLLPEELTPLFDRTVIQDPEGLDMRYLNYWLGLKLPGSDANPRSLKPIEFPARPNVVRATFEFSPEDIKKLGDRLYSQWDFFTKSEISENEKQREPLHLSTYAVTYAYTLICMVKAKGLKNNDKVKFGFTTDCRTRLDPPVSRNYIGNCVACFDVVEEVEHLLKETGVIYVAKRLREVMKVVENRVLEGAKERVPYMEMEPGVRVIILAAGSNHLGKYGADFGWGKPRNVEITSLDVGDSFSMMESKDGRGGVEIGLVLKKHEMEMFGSLFVDGLKMSRSSL